MSLVVDRDVAGVNFDDVMNQQHLEHPFDLNGWAGVILEDQGSQCEVPGVLSAGLAPRTVEEPVDAFDGGESVRGHEE